MTLLLTLVLMVLVVAAMGIGLFFGRRPLQGSCGGMAQLGLGECEICGGDPKRCEARVEPAPDGREGGSELGYDATRRDF